MYEVMVQRPRESLSKFVTRVTRRQIELIAQGRKTKVQFDFENGIHSVAILTITLEEEKNA